MAPGRKGPQNVADRGPHKHLLGGRYITPQREATGRPAKSSSSEVHSLPSSVPGDRPSHGRKNRKTEPLIMSQRQPLHRRPGGKKPTSCGRNASAPKGRTRVTRGRKRKKKKIPSVGKPEPVSIRGGPDSAAQNVEPAPGRKAPLHLQNVEGRRDTGSKRDSPSPGGEKKEDNPV